jgi:hypothetical protein
VQISDVLFLQCFKAIVFRKEFNDVSCDDVVVFRVDDEDVDNLKRFDFE